MLKPGDRVKFRNSHMVRKEGREMEPWWFYGKFDCLQAGGSENEAIDVDGGDKVYLCRKPDGMLDRFQFCEKV